MRNCFHEGQRICASWTDSRAAHCRPAAVLFPKAIRPSHIASIEPLRILPHFPRAAHTGAQHKQALAKVHGAESTMPSAYSLDSFKVPRWEEEQRRTKLSSHPWRSRRARGGTSRDEHSCPEPTTFFSFGPKKNGSACVQRKAKRDTGPGLAGLGACTGRKVLRERKTSCPFSLLPLCRVRRLCPLTHTRSRQCQGLLRGMLCCRSVNQHMHCEAFWSAPPCSAQVGGLLRGQVQSTATHLRVDGTSGKRRAWCKISWREAGLLQSVTESLGISSVLNFRF